MKKKPTRRDLLIVIGQLQTSIGRIASAANNDRSQNRIEVVNEESDRAFELCIEARSFDPPIETKSRNGWGV